MTETHEITVLLYQKDFTGLGGDQLYLFQNGELKLISPNSLFNIPSQIITHDYWLIAPFIFTQAQRLPI